MKLGLCTAVGVGLMLLSACAPARRAEPIVGPMTNVEASVKRGEQLYNMHCYQCHTAGEGGLGPSLNDKPLPRFAIHLQTRHGLGVMPGFSEQQLSDRQVSDIADYLVALRHHGVKR